MGCVNTRVSVRPADAYVDTGFLNTATARTSNIHNLDSSNTTTISDAQFRPESDLRSGYLSTFTAGSRSPNTRTVAKKAVKGQYKSDTDEYVGSG